MTPSDDKERPIFAPGVLFVDNKKRKLCETLRLKMRLEFFGGFFATGYFGLAKNVISAQISDGGDLLPAFDRLQTFSASPVLTTLVQVGFCCCCCCFSK